jgi:hypothetical protein
MARVSEAGREQAKRGGYRIGKASQRAIDGTIRVGQSCIWKGTAPSSSLLGDLSDV